MKRQCVAMVALVAAFAVGEVAASAYDNIWMHLHHGGLHSDKDLLFVSNAIVRASKAGIKGIMWPGGLDTRSEEHTSELQSRI